jgi:hypothetical protein
MDLPIAGPSKRAISYTGKVTVQDDRVLSSISFSTEEHHRTAPQRAALEVLIPPVNSRLLFYSPLPPLNASAMLQWFDCQKFIIQPEDPA